MKWLAVVLCTCSECIVPFCIVLFVYRSSNFHHGWRNVIGAPGSISYEDCNLLFVQMSFFLSKNRGPFAFASARSVGWKSISVAVVKPVWQESVSEAGPLLFCFFFFRPGCRRRRPHRVANELRFSSAFRAWPARDSATRAFCRAFLAGCQIAGCETGADEPEPPPRVSP